MNGYVNYNKYIKTMKVTINTNIFFFFIYGKPST